MDPLLYALGAPVIGALLYPALHDQPKLTRAFDRSMYVVVPLLVLIQVFGHQIAHDGWKPISIMSLVGAMALGLLIPISVEHISHGIAKKLKYYPSLQDFLGFFCMPY
ncbi:MAG: hypothetical protein OXI44_09440 [Bacteroidota bacterium]|nr:hypothetical protein [Bacteroidota bacterium]